MDTKTIARGMARIGSCSAHMLLFASLASMFAYGQSEPATRASQNGTSLEMANVLFRYSPDLTVLIVRLRGRLMPTPSHLVPSFNDSASFVITTDAAEMRMSTNQLAALMNSWLLRSPEAQLKHVRIAVDNGHLRILGTMKKGLRIPFEATATPGITNDNRIRFSIHEVKAAGVPVKGLMDAFGLTMENMVSQTGLHGISIDGDSILIDPQTALPPPQIRARISKVQISGQDLIISFGQGAPQLPSRPWRNYIALRGGSMEYGREEMVDSNLTMIDSTPADPFEFYLREYWCQLVEGTIKAQTDESMRVYVHDFSKLPKGACHR